jgi:cyclomaltodextrinase / maltogenic alpha-amylase / neopullulanase
MSIHTPDWVKNAVFYQIFPDRFARSSRLVHPRGIEFKPWGSPPEEQGFQGGDLLGIVDKLDYIAELGITALYLNPIFSSASNHRYHTFDYLQVDPLLGGNQALRELLDQAHSRGIKVVLDGVFNHASRGFWPFHHILEAGPNSPYLDWFTIKGWPLHPYPSTTDKPLNYEAWFNLPALPKLNTRNPGVRDYLLHVARFWIEFGIDGWRLDVPNEIDDDAFWQEFRSVVRTVNPDAYIVGEIWFPAQRWLQGDQFDAVMNYPLTLSALSFFGSENLRVDHHPGGYNLQPLDAPAFSQAIDRINGYYDWEINQAQLNLLDSHDMGRAVWVMGEDQSALRMAVLFQMSMPGAPCIYYGDEVGLSCGGDPYCRAAFPWDNKGSWDKDLLNFYRQAVSMRHQFPVLRTGDYHSLYASGNIFAFHRQLGDSEAVIVFNIGQVPITAYLPLQDIQARAFNEVGPTGNSQTLAAGTSTLDISISPRQAVVLISKENHLSF